MILVVLLDGVARLVCTEMWPGNIANVGSLITWSTGCASASPCAVSVSPPIAE